MSHDIPQARSRPVLLSLPESTWRPTPRLRRRISRVTRAATWRVLHPAHRESFLDGGEPVALSRLTYTTPDGWSAPLFHLPPRAGGAGEPVVLAHALGLGPDAYRYGGGPTLVSRLCRAGFSVYLLTHRGDRAAVGGPVAAADFDSILGLDVPAALRTIREHSGYARAHWVGHGLGGQLGLVAAGRDPSALASVSAIGAPVRFPRFASEWRARALALRLLPPGWRIPLRSLAEWAAPLTGEPGLAVSAARARGLMTYGAEDLPIALVRQVLRWMREGRLVSRDGSVDWTASLASGRAPLRLIVGEADPLWAPAFAEAAADLWQGPSVVQRLAGWTHLDAVVAEDAGETVHGPLVDWLVGHRRLAWGQAWAHHSLQAAI